MTEQLTEQCTVEANPEAVGGITDTWYLRCGRVCLWRTTAEYWYWGIDVYSNNFNNGHSEHFYCASREFPSYFLFHDFAANNPSVLEAAQTLIAAAELMDLPKADELKIYDETKDLGGVSRRKFSW